MANDQIADYLDEAAKLLHDEGDDPFRVRAYVRAAKTVRSWPESLPRLYRAGGIEALQDLPTIGPSIARAIRALILDGRLPMLDRLRADSDAIRLLASVIGVGRQLARRLHHDLGLATLDDLEAAAYDGRLAGLSGFGPRRVTAIRNGLAQKLGRQAPPSWPQGAVPSVEELLDVDREYRQRASAGALPRVAPHRLNPTARPWLPVMHTHRGRRRYTALFSNTERAHRLHTTHDWVVVYCDDGTKQQQFTVITATYGPLSGKRVVAGREAECMAWETPSAA